MRIIAGTHRGRRFDPPTFYVARPTTDFAKESLFNLINNQLDLEGTRALDLFSGTGSISYELMSRGCEYVCSVDINNKYLEFIKKTADIFNPDKKVIFTLKADVFKFLPKHDLNYDLIFADPPYDLEGIETIPDLIFNNETLKKDSVIVIEHSAAIDFAKHDRFKSLRNYGKVHFSFFS